MPHKIVLIVKEDELHTLLAALRTWQRQGCRSESYEIDLIASNDGSVLPLDVAGVGSLCNRINGGDPEVDELIEVLDNTKASLETMLAHFASQGPAADMAHREKIARIATTTVRKYRPAKHRRHKPGTKK